MVNAKTTLPINIEITVIIISTRHNGGAYFRALRTVRTTIEILVRISPWSPDLSITNTKHMTGSFENGPGILCQRVLVYKTPKSDPTWSADTSFVLLFHSDDYYDCRQVIKWYFWSFGVKWFKKSSIPGKSINMGTINRMHPLKWITAKIIIASLITFNTENHKVSPMKILTNEMLELLTNQKAKQMAKSWTYPIRSKCCIENSATEILDLT